jgi:hypothetical protein
MPHLRALIALLLLALPLDILWFLSIESHQFVARFAMDPEQLIEFRMDSLGVSMLGPLDQERHEPGRQCSDCVPIERLSLEYEPQHRVQRHYRERQGSGCDNAEASEPMADWMCGHAGRSRRKDLANENPRNPLEGSRGGSAGVRF